MSDFQSDLSDSAKAFVRVVWPTVQLMAGGGKLVPVEAVASNPITDMLDKYSGIDAWQVSNLCQVRGIASRVQWGHPYNTFTVRYQRASGARTEYEKRKSEIESQDGWLYPHLTIQAFISGAKGGDGAVLSAAVVKTADLIKACEKVLAYKVDVSLGGVRNTSNASFIWVSFDYLAQSGCDIKIYKSDKPVEKPVLHFPWPTWFPLQAA